MRKLLITVVAALLVIALLAAPVMAAGPDPIPVPDEAQPGADAIDDYAADQAADLEPGGLDAPPEDVPPDPIN